MWTPHLLSVHKYVPQTVDRCLVKKRNWEEEDAEYDPPYSDSSYLLHGSHPSNPSDVIFSLQGTLNLFEIDEYNYPLNPLGRTGLQGRNGLSYWGPNQIVHPIIVNEDNDTLFVFLHTMEYRLSIPGLFVSPSDAAEDLLSFFFKMFVGYDGESHEIYKGIKKHDWRNTDNSWLETTVSCIKTTHSSSLLNDFADCEWIPFGNSTFSLLDTTEDEQWIRRAFNVLGCDLK